MPKTAAAIAKEISGKTSKNRKAAADEVEDEIGGIEVEEEAVEEEAFRTGTPFDLVEGRPNVDFFGPLTAYGFVTTAHGEYAIEYGKILRFTAKKEWDKKTGQEVIRQYPVYEDAPQELIDYVMPLEVAS
jgi:hypothetical protein